MRWEISEEATDGGEAELRLAAELGVGPIVARLLRRRGHGDPERARAFLHGDPGGLPDPYLFRDMGRAVERIVAAVLRRERIVAYGDYDVDGVTATTELVAFLRAVGAEIDWYVPHRLREGYGLNPQAVERLAATGARLIVTLDCGVTAVSEVDRAAALGLDVVVVDHHQVSPELPRAVAILNPLQPGCDFPNKQLCAAGVTFFLLMALRRRLREAGAFASRPEPNLKGYLDLVALGTVADVVPLVGVNRELVRAGLVELGRGRRPGLRALCQVSGVDLARPLGAGQVGFKLGPRINAAGRLDDAGRAVRLLLAATWDEAVPIARELDRENEERRRLEADILAEALAQATARLAAPSPPRGLVLASPDWHPGVVGIVASRVAERTGRPTVLLALEGPAARGSGRSVHGFDLHAAFVACEGLLVRHGGHRAAAGLSLEAGRVDAFREAFEAHADRLLTPEQVCPRCAIDARVEASALTEALASDLARLAPFGAGNPEPVLATFGLHGKGRLLPAKGPSVEGHLKLKLAAREGDDSALALGPQGAGRPRAAPLEAIGFGMGGQLALLGRPLDAAFHLAVNEWQGRRSVELRLRALRPAVGP